MAAVQFSNIYLKEDGRWRFEWEAGDDEEFKVIQSGHLVDTVTGGSYVYQLPMSSFTDPPVLEVVPSDSFAESEENKPYLTLQWHAVENAVLYHVERQDGSDWYSEATYRHDGSTNVYTHVTKVFNDGETATYRITAINEYEQASSPLLISIDIVTTPVMAPFNGDIVIDYVNPNVEVTEA